MRNNPTVNTRRESCVCCCRCHFSSVGELAKNNPAQRGGRRLKPLLLPFLLRFYCHATGREPTGSLQRTLHVLQALSQHSSRLPPCYAGCKRWEPDRAQGAGPPGHRGCAHPSEGPRLRASWLTWRPLLSSGHRRTGRLLFLQLQPLLFLLLPSIPLFTPSRSKRSQWRVPAPKLPVPTRNFLLLSHLHRSVSSSSVAEINIWTFGKKLNFTKVAALRSEHFCVEATTA